MKKRYILISLLFVGSLGISLNEPYIHNVNKVQKSINTKGTIFETTSKEDIDAYYSTITPGDKGQVLIDKLYDVLKEGQLKVDYESGSQGGAKWNGYALADRDFTLSPVEESELGGKWKTKGIWIDPLYLTPIYIEKSINSGQFKYIDTDGTTKVGNFPSGGTLGMNREHVFPKSVGFSNDYKECFAGTDIHNLHCGDGVANQQGHSNLPYGDVVKNKTEYYSAIIPDKVCGYRGKDKNGYDVFEPLPEDKGDIARSIFYMATRYSTYENLGFGNVNPSLKLGTVSGPDKKVQSQTQANPATYGELDDLLKWHKEDPVNDLEINRNNVIYNQLQKNRNPFVDYPDWADACFGTSATGATFDNLNGKNPLPPTPPEPPLPPIDPDFNKVEKLTLTHDEKIKNTILKPIDINEFNVTYLVDDNEDELFNKNKVKYYYIDNDEEKELTDGIKLENKDYKVFATYLSHNSGKLIKSNEINLEVKYDSYTLQINPTNNFKTLYYQFEQFDPRGLEVQLVNMSEEVIQNITDYKIYLVTHTKDENLYQELTNKYTILGIGDMDLVVKYTYDGTEYLSNTIQVKFQLSLVQVIIIGVSALVTLIILIVIFVLIKKRKLRPKDFSNKVKKVSKKVKSKKK